MSDLCCCEYIDTDGQRNHLLACCCNCQDLDEGFEGLVSGTGIRETNKKQIVITVKDRMRVPWLGGARQINPNVALPVLVLPSFLLLATVSLEFTVISFALLLATMLILYKYCIQAMPRIFLMWSICSLIILYVIYQVIVVSFLMILLEENIGLSVAIAAAIYFAYKTKLMVIRLKEPIFSMKSSEKYNYCSLCLIQRPEGTAHHYWIDSCIIDSNKKYYLASLACTLCALVYSAMLTLSSVCHPFKFLFFLLPDDCSDVYQQMELTLSFVTAIYSLILAVFILCKMLSIFNWGCLCALPRRLLGNEQYEVVNRI